MSERPPPPDPDESSSLSRTELQQQEASSREESVSPAPDHSAQEVDEDEDEVAAAARAMVGQVVAERYRIECLLGAGAMGAVYRAEHVHMQKAVAFKVLHHQMSQNAEVVRRFEREAVAAGRIDHPNVAGARDFGRLEDGSFYLVLEYIDGKSLGQLMEEVGAMAPERVCHIAVQVAAALAAAHKEGIVHRDLKPDNVMMPISEQSADLVKVLDFGMAKLQQTDTSETKLTLHGAVYGTPQYMAPEQAAGQEVDHRADLYAWGLIVYEMLVGRPPFRADTMMALLLQHMTEKPAALPSSVPRPLSKLVMRCLEKEPSARPQSAEHLIEGLAPYLSVAYADPRRSLLGLSASAGNGSRPALPSVFTMRSQMAPLVERAVEKAEPLVERARPIWGPVGNASRAMIAWLRAPFGVRGRELPRWTLVAAALGFGWTLVWWGQVTTSEEISATAPVSTQENAQGDGLSGQQDMKLNDQAPPDPELAKVIRAAETGAETALYALKQRDEADRSITEWLGLAKGHLRWKEVEPALDAFGHALELDKRAAYEKELLSALRVLADDERFARPILDFAAERLGGVGADLLFHVWATTSLKTTSTAIAYDHLMASEVQAQYSPALQIAMDIRAAETCEALYGLLPQVQSRGDDRTLTRLRELRKVRGCGPQEAQDCYPCLRGDDALAQAMGAAAMRRSPQFIEKRFRFKK